MNLTFRNHTDKPVTLTLPPFANDSLEFSIDPESGVELIEGIKVTPEWLDAVAASLPEGVTMEKEPKG